MKRESAEELRARLLADEQVHSLIAMRAYEIFELRGGMPGREAEDWLQAEAEILQFVIEEELRRSEAHSSVDESALFERPTPAFSFPDGATEKGLEIYVIATDAASSAQPATLAASAGGGSKKDPTPAKTSSSSSSSSSEASTESNSPPKKAASRLKPPKVSAKKASSKVKAPKKAGKTKQSKQRSPDTRKDK